MATSPTLNNFSCPVCGGENPKFYYGGVCCLPCKSFFVRAVTGVYPHQCCTGRENCVILPNELHNCKGCRYRRCLEAGMKPTLVCLYRKYPDVVGRLENKDGLIYQHIIPTISLGFHFIAQATYYTGPLQSELVNIVEEPHLSYFNLNISLPDAFLNSSLCFSKEEVIDPSMEELLQSIIPHGFCKLLASFIDFASAVPELQFLSQADIMKLVQNNRFSVITLRAYYLQHVCPHRTEIQRINLLRLSFISEGHAAQLGKTHQFFEQHGSPLFTQLYISEEELTLLRLVAVVWPFTNCSDEGSDILRKARGKYLNILIGYHNEVFPTATAFDRLQRICRLMDFLSKLRQFCEELNKGITLLVLNNTCNVLGSLSYDVQVRNYSD